MSTPHITVYFKELLASINGELEPSPDFLARQSSSPQSELSVDRYTDEEVMLRERDRLFKRYPLVLGHQGWVEAGQSVAHEVVGIPLIITNDGERIRVFLNQCSHRSTRLIASDQPETRRAIVCPYHHWSYGLDGALKGYPQPEGFPDMCKERMGLRELPSAVRHGLIYAILDPEAALDIDAFLDEMSPLLDETNTGEFAFFRRSRSEWNTNWKLPIDAFLEAYHLHHLHKETLAPLFLDNVALARNHNIHMSAAVARQGIEQANSTPEDQWDLRNLVTFTWYLLPNTVIIYHPDYTSVVSFYPVAADRSIIDHTMLIPEKPKNEKEQGHWERAFDMTDRMSFGDEDFHICEEMQSGLRAGGREVMTLGTYEQAVLRFHQTLERMMR